MKFLSWVKNNVLFVSTLFLLAFIPLYPKIPVIDVKHTWVYVRIEDFLVALVLFFWIVLFFRRKITLRTPLTLPIFFFWIIGALATIHGVLLVFPTIADVFPNLALLSFLRRIEYVSLFFIAYSGMKDKRFLKYVIIVLILTLLAIVGYGFGQKYLDFPAYLTMNEEFAKGEPIRLSALSRVPSTFAGHYDLAAYLVLILPILTSLLFGFRNWLVRIVIFISVSLGFVLLFMTVSRVSFFVLLLSLGLVLIFQKKKIAIFSLAALSLIVLLFLSQTPALKERFANTIKEVDVLVDATTGDVIGNTKIIPASDLQNKVILRRYYENTQALNAPIDETYKELLNASPSAFVPYQTILGDVVFITPPNASTGENLPQGTGYINLSLSPVTKRLGEFFYENPKKEQTSPPVDTFMFEGNYLIKRASAYDLSFTTRFQGEWPNAVEAFKRNIFLGSGYSSLGLAIDNNYLRILGEIGLIGFASFIAIFIIVGIYIKRVLPEVTSPVARSFVLGFTAGMFGLMMNAILIDVFEASKVAFVFWLLTGVTLGLLSVYKIKYISISKELKVALTSPFAIILYILFITLVVFSPMLGNFFVGDDYTWFSWASDCVGSTMSTVSCPSVLERISQYFLDAGGFFYRPGTKIYFFIMHSVFWLNQTIYHAVSILLHFLVTMLLFFLARKILRSDLFAACASFLFLIISGYAEIIFWSSATGYLFNALFALLSLLFFSLWLEKKNIFYFVATFISASLGLLFHEVGVVIPLLLILYSFITDESFRFKKLYKNYHFPLLFLPVIFYLLIRFIAKSHWFSGDYSYNLLKLPFNVIGNSIGYLSLTILGPISVPFNQLFRNIAKEHIVLSFFAALVLGAVLIFVYRFIIKKIDKQEKRIIIFGFLFFLIALLPFLGLGNMSSRYSYLASIGVVIIFALFIKKLYYFLLSNGKEIALIGTATLFVIFFLLHVIQIQQIHSDWYEAGKKTKNFFISMDSMYADYWSDKPVEFHFVNVPERVGEAWVFAPGQPPVGLQDAVWLVYRNPNIRVYNWPTVEEALRHVDGTIYKKVFVFEGSGKLTEKRKTRYLQ